MAERHHAGVANEQIGRHRQKTPDQDLGQEATPEHRQHQRRHRQERDDHSKPDPIHYPMARAHFGVGAKRPVGRNSNVKIRTTNETMIDWEGLTHKDA